MDHGVGKTLRAARLARGIELAEVEAATRIRARFLRAIEAEEWEDLPGEAYARGFIRTYAAYLGLDGNPLAEQHRREVGAERPGERLLGADPSRPQPARPPRRRRPPSRAAALALSALLVAVLLVVGLSGGEEEAPSPPVRERPRLSVPAGAQRAENRPASTRRPDAGLSLQLTATAEVWVCLLDAADRPLVEGQILGPGAEAGPFRSGSFTVSLGNGEVAMTVNGQQASIPSTPSPIGYSIGSGGALRELSEGERPTCT
jgi:helix-turn-helix protein